MGRIRAKLLSKVRQEIVETTVEATGLTPSQAVSVIEGIKTIAEGAKTPSPRSISGANDIYLPKIMKDFPNFSNSDAEVSLKEFIGEYLAIKYKGQEDFTVPNVGRAVLGSIERAQGAFEVDNIVINKVAIAGYEKSEEYATIRYQVSCGYDVLSGTETERVETRYKMEYSLRFVDDGESAVTYICPNCNATLGVSVHGQCPYCDARIVMDTIYSWYVSSISEN